MGLVLLSTISIKSKRNIQVILLTSEAKIRLICSYLVPSVVKKSVIVKVLNFIVTDFDNTG